MQTLACGHVAYEAKSRVCPHLVRPPEDGAPQLRLLTGRRLEYDIVCEGCAAGPGPVDLAAVCEGCVARLDEDAEDGELTGWRGQPGIEEAPEPVDPTIVSWRLPSSIGPVIDLAPGGSPDTWMALTAGHTIAVLRPDADRATVVASDVVVAETGRAAFPRRTLGPRLHVSACGRFAAVANDYGRHGRVVDLHRGGKTVLMLDGGSYHQGTVPFSVVFASHEGRPVVVHRTEWNRLDVHDAETGRLLTSRTQERAEPGTRPPHHLDYFHGRLLLSPDGRFLADDGWVWSPVGLPTVFDLRRWLDGNVWEAEDGPSWRRLCQRAYHWDTPMCFVGDRLLAISGIGIDDEAMLDGVRIFSATTGDEVNQFAGPTGALFADRHRLYAASPDGLQIWDPVTGRRTATVPGVVPSCHHRAAGELAEVRDGALHRWSTG